MDDNGCSQVRSQVLSNKLTACCNAVRTMRTKEQTASTGNRGLTSPASALWSVTLGCGLLDNRAPLAAWPTEPCQAHSEETKLYEYMRAFVPPVKWRSQALLSWCPPQIHSRCHGVDGLMGHPPVVQCVLPLRQLTRRRRLSRPFRLDIWVVGSPTVFHCAPRGHHGQGISQWSHLL